MRYRDRVHAGRELACELAGRFTGDAVVLGLSGGGVVVGSAVAGSAGATLGEHRPKLALDGRTVLIVDEALSTGAEAVMACETARAAGARRVVVAVPVASIDAAGLVRAVADEVSVLQLVGDIGDVADWYDDPTPVAPEAVAAALVRHGGPTLFVDVPSVEQAHPALHPDQGDPGPHGQGPPVLLQAG